jgi:nucleotide-binding universal stress UspA family protein
MSIFPTTILLATDGSGEARLAARTALDLAQKTGSELHVVHVVDAASSVALLYPEASEPKRAKSVALLYPEATDTEGEKRGPPAWKEDLEQHLQQGGREFLDGEVERVRSAGGTVAQTHLRMGEAAREIVLLAEELGAGLIVMGSRGHGGIRRALMGSVSESVVRHAHCPVTIVRE